jgi:hypothetical protein
MIKNFIVMILIGIIIGGGIMWRVMPQKDRIIEKERLIYDTSYQVITKTTIKVVYRNKDKDNSNNSKPVDADEIYTVIDTGGSQDVRIIKVRDTLYMFPKSTSIIPLVGYDGKPILGCGVGYKGWNLSGSYEFKNDNKTIFIQKEF